MSRASDPHPAPHADKLSTRYALFILFGAPLAWFAQLCGSVPLVGWACFPTTDRFAMPVAHFGWTRSAAILLTILCLGVALASAFAALAKFREVRSEKAGGKTQLIEVGHGRTRFTALWGVILGFSFTLAIALTAVPFLMVRQCAG